MSWTAENELNLALDFEWQFNIIATASAGDIAVFCINNNS